MSERFAAVASRAQHLDGFAQTLEPVSTAGRYKQMMNIADNAVYATCDGSAWFKIYDSSGPTGGGGGSLDAAYLLGNQINLTDAGGAVVLSSARTSGSILQVTTTNAPATVAGSITGIAIDMSSLGTAATPAAVNLPAITIVGARSYVAKASGAALVQISSAYRNATAVSIALKNKQALAGSCVSIGWSSENYEGAVASTEITDTTHIVTIDGASNVDTETNNREFVGLRIRQPVTTDGSSSAIRALASSPWFNGGTHSGNLVFVEDSTQCLGVGSLEGAVMLVRRAVSPSGGGNLTYSGTCLRVENVSDPGFGTMTDASAALLVLHRPVSGGSGSKAVSIASSQTSGEISTVSMLNGTTLVLSTAGFSIDLATGVTAGAVDVTGMRILIPESSSTATRILSLGTLQTAGDLVNISFTGLTTISGTTVGIRTDLATNVSPTGAQIVGHALLIPESSSVSTRGITIKSLQTGGYGTYTSMEPGSSAAVIGHGIAMGANTSTSGAAQQIVWSSRNGCTNGIIDIALNVTSPTSAATTFFKIRSTGVWAGETGALTGINVDFDTNVAASSTNPLICGYFNLGNDNNNISDRALVATSNQLASGSCVLEASLNAAFSSNANAATFFVGANTVSSTLGVGTALWARVAATQGRGIYVATETITAAHTAGYLFCTRRAGTWSGGGTESLPLNEMARVESITNSATISGQVLAIYNGPTNTDGTLTQSGHDVTITRAHTRTTGTVNLSGSLLALVHAPTGTINTDTTSLITGTTIAKSGTMLSFTSTATLAGALAMLSLSGSGVTAGGNNFQGLVITTPAGSANTSSAIDIEWRGTSGTTTGYGIVRVVGNATTTASLTGVLVDLDTSVTPGSNAVSGIRIGIPGSSNAGTRGINISSAQTGAGSSGLAITMTPGSSASVVGASISMANANAQGAALTIAHSGTNANQLVFTSAVDGTGAHIYGPTTGTLTIKAGVRADAGAGRSIDIFAAVGLTTGQGGSVNIAGADGVGSNQDGGNISLQTGAPTGSGVKGHVDFVNDAVALGGGAAATLGTVGGSGPATAGQNQWVQIKVGGNIRWFPVWA